MKWNIFKHKDKKLTWDDISYKTFMKILSHCEDEKINMDAIMQAVYGDDVLDLPIIEYNEKIKTLQELLNPIPHDKHVKNIKVNGRSYRLIGLLGDISAAQYIDYNNWLKRNDLIKSFSAFIVPEGHAYNDGYDMDQVISDIEDMHISDIMSAAFFFRRQLDLFIRIFLSSLRKKVKKEKTAMTPIEKSLLEILENFNNLDALHMF